LDGEVNRAHAQRLVQTGWMGKRLIKGSCPRNRIPLLIPNRSHRKR
jgi:hypothetical protein